MELFQGRVKTHFESNMYDMYFSFGHCAPKDNIANFIQGERSTFNDSEPFPATIHASTDAEGVATSGVAELLSTAGLQ